MRILLSVALAFILTCAIVACARPDGRARSENGTREPSTLLLVLLALMTLALGAAHVVLNRYLVFDDAYAAYRSAKELAFGHGLVMNGDAPSDGTASLLLVAFLAPFVHFRADPLTVTRVASGIAAFGIAGIVYLRQRAEASQRRALLFALIYCLSNLAFAVAMLGVESLLVAFAIYLAYHFATEYLATRRLAALRVTGGALLAAALLEPRCVLLAVIVSAIAAPRDFRERRGARHAAALGLTFWLPVVLLFAFRGHYFGALLPQGSRVGDQFGGVWAESAFGFLGTMWKLVLLAALAGLLVASAAKRCDRTLAALFVCAYAALHLRADAHSDLYQHLFFPATPLLFELALPAIAQAFAWLSSIEPRIVGEASMFLFVALGVVPERDGVNAIAEALRGGHAFAEHPSDERHEYGQARHLLEVGRALAEYPQMSRVTLAASGANALVYASDARNVDLTDPHLFARAPELILDRADWERSVGAAGPSREEARLRWTEDRGWDDYAYAGSVVDPESSRNARHVFVRKSAPAELTAFVRRRVVDYVLRVPPVYGTELRERRQRALPTAHTPPLALAARERLPLSIAPDRNYLVDASGAPFLLRGDAAWSSSHELDRDAFRTYLADRKRRGFNAFLLNVVDHTQGPNGYPNAAREPPFLVPGDFGTPNERYFTYVDWLLREAQDAGFVVFVCPAYLGYLGGDEGWYTNLLRNGPAKLREYGRFVGRRWRELDNIVWMNAGDFTPPPEGMLLVNAVARGIKDVDTRHLQTAHFGPETSGGDIDPDYLDIDTTYTYRPTYLKVGHDHAVDRGRRPLVLVESLYENEHQTRPPQIRAEAYHAFLNGASGNFYGSFPVWNFGKGWREALDSPGSRAMTHIFTLFEALPWWTLEPEPPNVTLISGRGQFGSDNYASIARSRDGTLVVAYVPSARELRVDLARLARPAAARWFDPTSGRSRPIAEGILTNDRIRTFAVPGPNDAGDPDWVLVLDARGDLQ